MNSTIAFWGLGVLCVIACVVYIKRGIKYSKVCTDKVDAILYDIERLHAGSKREYLPWYKYRVNGVEYKVRGSSTKSRRKYHVGDESFVIYNPENPNECLIEGKNSNIATAIIFGILAVLFIVFAIFIK
ncbi:MAG: DUF3592 domain-containing protein [Clostridia bacterium]|nr:DUF3592 domain-containing protein [Clostridia bacterium]